MVVCLLPDQEETWMLQNKNPEVYKNIFAIPNSFWLWYYHLQIMFLFSNYVPINLPALMLSVTCLQNGLENLIKSFTRPHCGSLVPPRRCKRRHRALSFAQQICSRGCRGSSDSLFSLQPTHKLPYFSGISAAGLWIGHATGKTTMIVCPGI